MDDRYSRHNAPGREYGRGYDESRYHRAGPDYGRTSARDQALLLRDILRTLHDIRVIMRERGPSAVFVVNDERAGRLGRGTAVNPTRPR